MILNELTNADAIEAVREETWEATWNEAWEKASEATWEEAQKRIIALVQKGLTGAQLEQAIQRERRGLFPKPPRRKAPSVSRVSLVFGVAEPKEARRHASGHALLPVQASAHGQA